MAHADCKKALIIAGRINRYGYDFANRVYSTDGLARTLMGGGGNNDNKTGYYLIIEDGNQDKQQERK